MRAGRLRRQMTLEQPSETAGDAVVTWTTVATVWAEMSATGGSDTGLEATGDYRFRIRYRADVTAKWRLGLGATRKFNLVAPPQDPDGRARELVLVAREALY